MNFSYEQLLAFVTVYDELSFSKAAIKLNKHRTTIGQVVTNLEDQLLVTLFNRIGRRVEPTENGVFLYHYAKQAIEQARTFDKVALTLSSGPIENVTIGYCSFLPHKILSDIRVQLMADFPLMRVNFLVRTKMQIKQGISDGSIDFGIVNIHDSRAMHSFDSMVLGYLEFRPFVKRGGQYSKLAPNEVVSVLSRERQFVLRTFVEENLEKKVIVSANYEEVDQLALVIKLISEDCGWSFLPTAIMASEFATNKIQLLDFDGMKEGFKFGMALWCPFAKQNREVKASIVTALDLTIAEIKEGL